MALQNLSFDFVGTILVFFASADRTLVSVQGLINRSLFHPNYTIFEVDLLVERPDPVLCYVKNRATNM